MRAGFVLGSLVPAGSTQAFDFYIGPNAPVTNVGTTGGTQANPWNIAAINDSTSRTMYSGKRVGWLDGVYNLNAVISAAAPNIAAPIYSIEGGPSSSSPTVMKSVNPRGAQLVGWLNNDGVTYPTAGAFMLGQSISQRSGQAPLQHLGNVVIDGFYMAGGVGGFIIWDGGTVTPPAQPLLTGCVVQNCETFSVTAVGSTGQNLGHYKGQSTRGAIVQNCVMHGTYSNGFATLANSSLIFSFVSESNLYQNNTLYDSPTGIHDKNPNVNNSLIQFNYIELNGNPSNPNNAPSACIEDCTGGVNGTTTTVQNNILVIPSTGGNAKFWFGSDFQNGFGGNNLPDSCQSSIVFANNTCVTTGQANFFIQCLGDVAGATSAQHHQYNNIILTTGANIVSTINGAVGQCDGSGCQGVQDYNIWSCTNPTTFSIASTRTAAGFLETQTSTAFTVAQWQAHVPGIEQHSNISTIAPSALFTNPNVSLTPNGYKLLAGSAATGTGRVGGVSTGAVCDMGAWGGPTPPAQIGANFAALAPLSFTQVFSFASLAGPPAGTHLANSAAVSGTGVALTTGGHNDGAMWYTTQQNIQAFRTDFTFQFPGGMTVPWTTGFVFSVQNSNSTNNPINSGINISCDANIAGYGAFWFPAPPGLGSQYPLQNSIGVKFDPNNQNGNSITYRSGGSPNTTGLYINGGPSDNLCPQDDLSPLGISFYTNHVMACSMIYDGSILTMTLKDTTTNAQVRKSWPVNIPGAINSNTAWVGFSAGQVSAGPGPSILTWDFYSSSSTSTSLPRLGAPSFNVQSGLYASAQTVTISGPAGATIFYSTNGQAPTTSSTQYTGPVIISASTFLQAVCVETGFTDSPVASENYVIGTAGTPTINFPSPNGFTGAGSLISPVGVAAITGSSLVLTPGAIQDAVGCGWYVAPVNIASFTTNFTLSLASNAQGCTFCIQNQTPGSAMISDGKVVDSPVLWASGGPLAMANSQPGLGYSGNTGSGAAQNTGFLNSVAIKFDVFTGPGTGLYTNGADVSQNTLSTSPVSLSAGHTYNVSLSYSGTTLNLTITDNSTSQVFGPHAFTVNIPSVVGGNTAYVGFTASAGGGAQGAISVTNWTGF